MRNLPHVRCCHLLTAATPVDVMTATGRRHFGGASCVARPVMESLTETETESDADADPTLPLNRVARHR